MPSVSPVKVWSSEVEPLLEMSLQFWSKLPPPTLRLYCHLLIVPLPVTEAASFSSPLAEPAVTVGLAGWPGSVRKSSLASSFAFVQPLSLYAFQV